MSEETRQVLEMLKAGKVTVEEAERLLAALGDEGAKGGEAPKGSPRYLRAIVSDGDKKVNVRVPMKLLRAGMKFSALIPEQARGQIEKHLGEKGIDLDMKRLKPADVEELIASLAELNVEVEEGGEKKVRVFCE